jgi:hypothetical protein
MKYKNEICETNVKNCSYLHSHWLIWLKDTPRGPTELRQLMENEGEEQIANEICDFYASIATGAYPRYFDFHKDMKCPNCQNRAMKEQELGSRFSMSSEYHFSYPYVVKCTSCGRGLRGREHIANEAERILKHYKEVEGINPITQEVVELIRSMQLTDLKEATWTSDATNFVEFGEIVSEHDVVLKELLTKKIPESTFATVADDIICNQRFTWKHRVEYLDKHRSRLVATAKLAFLYLEKQEHDDGHKDTCFKKGNFSCRSGYPRSKVAKTMLAQFVELERGTFSEYINNCNEAVSRSLLCNNDVKLLFTVENIGCLLVYYIVKYVTKRQDTYAKAVLESHLVKHVKRFMDAQDRVMNRELERFSFDNSNSNSSPAELRKRAVRLACTLFNIIRTGEQLDVTYCLFFIKERKEYWCSHEFVTLYLRDIVKEVLFKEERLEVHMREDQFAGRNDRFVQDSKYIEYQCRPVELVEQSFYEYAEGWFKKNKTGIKNQKALKFQAKTPNPGVNYLCAQLNPDIKRCVNLVGVSFPSHFQFEPSVYTILGFKENGIMPEPLHVRKYIPTQVQLTYVSWKCRMKIVMKAKTNLKMLKEMMNLWIKFLKRSYLVF